MPDRPGSGASPFRVFLQHLPDEIERARLRGQPVQFPVELVAHGSARRLLESIGVEIVTSVVTVDCALCDWTFTGAPTTRASAIERHRRTAHGAGGVNGREVLDRMDAGESVAAAPIEREESEVEVQCKIEGCTNRAPARGRYAKLCKTHRARGVREETVQAVPRKRRTTRRRVMQPVRGGSANGSLASAAALVDARVVEFEAARSALADAVESLRKATEAVPVA